MYRKHRLIEPFARVMRLLDAYVPLRSATVRWRDILQPSGLFDVAASIFMRPVAEGGEFFLPLRRWRLRSLVRRAAKRGEIAHIWWHPHNFGVATERNLALLRDVLDTYVACSQQYGMKSLCMADVADELGLRSGPSDGS